MFYIIVGSDKCGTSALAHHLKLHPEINCTNLELDYFSKNKRYYNISKELYEKMLKSEININDFYNDYNKNINPQKDLNEEYFIFVKNNINSNSKKNIHGEKSPSYMVLYKAIDRIHENYSNIKILISLREPVKRLYSSYTHLKTYIEIELSFLELIKEQEKNTDYIDSDVFMLQYSNFKKQSLENTLQRGFYINYIEYIYSKFPKENIYICIQEEFLKNPLEEYNKLYKFLGAKELTQEEFKFDTNVNKGKYKEPISDEDFKYTYNIYKEYNEKLYKFLGRRIESWDEIYQKYGLI
jgi:hypothetical protein